MKRVFIRRLGRPGSSLVNKDLGHHEVGGYDGDNHGVVLVDTLEVSVSESDRIETL